MIRHRKEILRPLGPRFPPLLAFGDPLLFRRGGFSSVAS